MLSPHVGVSCRREGADHKTMTGIKLGENWVGRKVDRYEKTYTRQIIGGLGWVIEYVDQNGNLRRCSALGFQKWAEKWDARPMPIED